MSWWMLYHPGKEIPEGWCRSSGCALFQTNSINLSGPPACSSSSTLEAEVGGASARGWPLTFITLKARTHHSSSSEAEQRAWGDSSVIRSFQTNSSSLWASADFIPVRIKASLRQHLETSAQLHGKTFREQLIQKSSLCLKERFQRFPDPEPDKVHRLWNM